MHPHLGSCSGALLADPEQSLREAWTLNSRILEELLALASNDIGDFELAKMIISWQALGWLGWAPDGRRFSPPLTQFLVYSPNFPVHTQDILRLVGA